MLESGSFSNDPILRTAGLSGNNQIIGISDTGLDVFSNYFYDPNVTVTFNALIVGHRKLVTYTTTVGSTVYGDNTDITDGHGTHGTYATPAALLVQYSTVEAYE